MQMIKIATMIIMPFVFGDCKSIPNISVYQPDTIVAQRQAKGEKSASVGQKRKKKSTLP
jgi:hypothetical protein